MSERPRFVHDIPIRPQAAERPRLRGCAVAGCLAPGEYRAPKSPNRLEDHLWLCLDHVRAHNQAWDFFRGWSDAEIEGFIRGNLTGHRPTFPMGLARGRDGRTQSAYRDPFAFFREPGARPDHVAEREPLRTRIQVEALTVLELEETASLNEVKLRYKELVKRYHPDANGGDRSSEDRLKRVIRAYRTLRASNLA